MVFEKAGKAWYLAVMKVLSTAAYLDGSTVA
jgi:hypothetical protein